jgi:mRNA interferase MazF
MDQASASVLPRSMPQTRPTAIPRLRRALVAPCTTTVRGLASEVVLQPDNDPVPRRSSINLDSVESVSVAALVERLGRLSDDRMRDVCAALDVAVQCHSQEWAVGA